MSTSARGVEFVVEAELTSMYGVRVGAEGEGGMTATEGAGEGGKAIKVAAETEDTEIEGAGSLYWNELGVST